jgi:hypothetical protein
LEEVDQKISENWENFGEACFLFIGFAIPIGGKYESSVREMCLSLNHVSSFWAHNFQTEGFQEFDIWGCASLATRPKQQVSWW